MKARQLARGSACGALLLGALVLYGGQVPAEEPPADEDAFLVALADLGVRADQLGYAPRAHWQRYPHPATTPYVLPFFSDLLARPQDTYEFVRTLGNAVEDGLSLDALRAAPDAKDRREALFRLAVLLGTERRIGGFRGYSANLDAEVADVDPLVAAVALVRERAGAPLVRPMAFGGAYADGADQPRAALSGRLAAVPEALRVPLARLLLDLCDARRWIDLGLRHVDPETRRAVFATLGGLSEETPDGLGYDAVLDDVAGAVDEYSLHYGAVKAMQALHDARRALAAAVTDEIAAFDVRESTPWGDIWLRSGTDAEVSAEAPPFCYVQVGVQSGATNVPLGTTTAERPLSVALLVEHGDLDGSVGGRVPHGGLGSGVLGCGAVYAAKAREGTTARVERWGLGAALFGMGAFVAEEGATAYDAKSMAQGAAFFGSGLLLDAAGDDSYHLVEGDGQGFGGPGGVGVLADRQGNDHYRSEPRVEIAGRGDYHSDGKIAVSNAQGVGSGRRGDGSDGHSWAGGLGALLDVDGDDVYEAGNFSQGLGYWYGTGVLWDGGGDDRFESVYFTQGSGAHFAIGALVDEGGNDVHKLLETSGAGLGFGWDVVNAFLIDRGTGNDHYEAAKISLGVAEVRSNAFFLDEGGDDTYVVNAKGKLLGDVDERPTYATPHRTAPFAFHIGQIGLFLDLGGTDRYLERAGDGEPTPSEKAGDGRTWNLRPQSGPGAFNVALGRDLDGATSRWLTGAWPPR
ncbi:MAG: hypothetical protein R3F05_04970 [Planctomycetota bacterium]|nr:hypothetical protein [Planctomycetota bacterium]MCB9825773.1 hypothetical protein [Planctomycetota bacterium]